MPAAVTSPAPPTFRSACICWASSASRLACSAAFFSASSFSFFSSSATRRWVASISSKPSSSVDSLLTRSFVPTEEGFLVIRSLDAPVPEEGLRRRSFPVPEPPPAAAAVPFIFSPPLVGGVTFNLAAPAWLEASLAAGRRTPAAPPFRAAWMARLASSACSFCMASSRLSRRPPPPEAVAEAEAAPSFPSTNSPRFRASAFTNFSNSMR
mmetsp:Transcript_2428/g.7072  ORF Transcript_2428/g.7072 Transcript_2428/m.7072 type:complete len:210 (-) Transcript_2428:548-1177(-)